MALKKIQKPFISVGGVIFFALLIILLLHLFSAARIFSNAIADYNQAKQIFFLNDISDDLYTAVGNFGFERGRVNVVLNDAGPVEGMTDNRLFIIDRRTEGDEALSNALFKLSQNSRVGVEEDVERINQLTRKIDELRKLTSKDLVIPKDQRKIDLPDTWFTAMTDYIMSIKVLLGHISNTISDSDGMISRYSSLKNETFSLRNTAGPEMSIMAATILSGSPLPTKLAQEITKLQIDTDRNFQAIEYLSQSLQNSQIPAALAVLKTSYYDNYVPLREIIFPLTLKGGPYPLTQSEFLKPGVEALQQIAAFMKTVVEETRRYTHRKYNEGKRRIILQAIISTGSTALIILILLFVRHRIILPISQLTAAVYGLSQKDLNVEVPQQKTQNEIGEMARAVEYFKRMAIQLDETVITLEKTSAEREILICELQKTFNELKVLRGILPICSICKNIRNEQGAYEQIETYLHKHSDADFSHTICPSCVKKHYPEQYKELKKKGEI